MINTETLATFQSLKQAMAFLDEIAKERRVIPSEGGENELIYLVDGKELTIVKDDRTQWRWRVVRREPVSKSK